MIYAEGDRGDYIFRVMSGAVRLSVARADGRELLYILFEPGDCFGISSLIDNETLPHTAEAAETSEIQMLSRADFTRLRAEHREFDNALLHLVTRHMRLLSHYFANAHLDDVHARVANRIVSAAESFGRPDDGGIALSIGLSQSEVALMVGASRQTVNRVIQDFQKDGLLSVRGNKLVIHQLERLQARARG